MKSAEYHSFVRRTDQYAKRLPADRLGIALYGLVGEIGSLVSAIKKKLLSENGEKSWDQPNEEIKEEIGDALWYCYSLAQVVNEGAPFDILANDIRLLAREIGGDDERAAKIRSILDPVRKDAFLTAATAFPAAGTCSFNEYQQLAFNTARTDGRVLLEVCLALLQQLSAELLRPTLPDIEIALNKNIADREANTVLGEVAWHLAAIASLYRVSLDDIVEINRTKVSFRAERGDPTPLHDEGRDVREQFPRTFDVAFVRIGKGRSRRYFEGRRLGDDLTDNASEDDGYRFHDVLHLALVAHLGWSPVFRGMMKRKRPDVDEVEDGGRAKVVEELVLKAVHSEGERQAEDGGRRSVDGPIRIFPDPSTVPFRLLKTLRTWVEGLEVWKNYYWEWEDAICKGCEIFFQLRQHEQGTVTIDLTQRRLTFNPRVTPNLSGITVGLGTGVATEFEDSEGIFSDSEREWAESKGLVAETAAAKKALLGALGFSPASSERLRQVELQLLNGVSLSVRATGEVQERVWHMRAVDYKATFAVISGQTLCTVIAIADPMDVSK